jgi:hypothetical protein
MKFYICLHCGELTTSQQLDDNVAMGGAGSCYCQFMTLVWSQQYQDFEPEYFREFTDYTEIPEAVYRGLSKQSNHVLRLEMLRTVHL